MTNTNPLKQYEYYNKFYSISPYSIHLYAQRIVGAGCGNCSHFSEAEVIDNTTWNWKQGTLLAAFICGLIMLWFFILFILFFSRSQNRSRSSAGNQCDKNEAYIVESQSTCRQAYSKNETSQNDAFLSSFSANSAEKETEESDEDVQENNCNVSTKPAQVFDIIDVCPIKKFEGLRYNDILKTMKTWKTQTKEEFGMSLV